MSEVPSRRTILIVDDTPENIDVLQGIIGRDYQVKATTKGATAIKIASSSTPPDLILLDIMMPGMDGFEVCKRLKENIATRNIPVIFVTARNDAADEARGLELGGVDYLTKPVSPAIVQARIKTHLALFDQNRALAEKVRERTLELEESRLEVIRRLGRAAEYKDNETGLHVIRMSKTSSQIALASGLGNDYAELILHTAPMHDVGKIGIPDRILLKPGPLDKAEWHVMKTHCFIGAKIIGKHSSELIKEAGVAALTHHEKWDGTGYPRGLKGEEIPITGRIIAIADVFDALTSDRPYKNAWPVDAAVTLIKRESGAHFDPALVPIFLEVLPEVLEMKKMFAEGQSREDFHN